MVLPQGVHLGVCVREECARRALLAWSHWRQGRGQYYPAECCYTDGRYRWSEGITIQESIAEVERRDKPAA
jgi:hypothetical protein